MNYLNKILSCIKNDAKLFQNPEINHITGLTNTQIKELKKYVLENNLIQDCKREITLTDLGIEYLEENPLQSWCNQEMPKRPEINIESLKLEKAPPTLTRAIRLLAKHLIEGEDLKPNSNEDYLQREFLSETSNCKDLKTEIEEFILNPSPQPSPAKGEGASYGKVKLTELFDRFSQAPYGLTKSITAILLLDVITTHRNVLAIYEQGQFQLKLNQLMFDRMIYCPQNFELQKTVLDLPILEGLSEALSIEPSKNILDVTKGLIYLVRKLEKYTLNTERLSKPTLRFRNCVMNAKDPISLFNRDIPKILVGKDLTDCNEELINAFKTSINELLNCCDEMIAEITEFFFKAFDEIERANLVSRTGEIKEYLNEDELKILANNIAETSSDDTLWIKRIATFINKSRVPSDWSDNDVADFKVKTKELALKFLTIEATASDEVAKLNKNALELLEKLLSLSKIEKNTILRRIVNG
ncbi:MAG: hypothetical protein R3Y28_07115 [Candidatus Gastranaerophilales bacterium]